MGAFCYHQVQLWSLGYVLLQTGGSCNQQVPDICRMLTPPNVGFRALTSYFAAADITVLFSS